MDPSQIEANAQRFADVMSQFRRRAGEAYGALSTHHNQIADDLFKTKDNTEALSRFMSFLGQLPQAQRNAFSEMFTGDRNFARLTGDGNRALVERLKEARARIGEIGPEAQKQAVEAERGFNNLRNSLEGLRNAIGTETLPVLNRLVTGAGQWVQINSGRIGQGLADSLRSLGEALEDVPWQKIGDEVLTFARDARDLLGGLAGAARETASALKSLGLIQGSGSAEDDAIRRKYLTDRRARDQTRLNVFDYLPGGGASVEYYRNRIRDADRELGEIDARAKQRGSEELPRVPSPASSEVGWSRAPVTPPPSGSVGRAPHCNFFQ